ncbi:hypothetical protein C0216_19590 [Streptomyces globosus]|uniref:Toxin-antitoxin system, toxin component n=1 Tax=Streptomyces globosus TaxID=68209 RepID=A0A344U385_9ACTN|nr:hypothetical protein [Streptomyces globosus]AXE25356.1 hypothetical protein C0216_19590 [Streptomyces globosus]
MATPPPQHGAGPYAQHGPQYGPQYGPPYGSHVPQQGPGPYPPVPGPPPVAPQGPYGMPVGPAGVPDCRICGSVPAVRGTVRGHQGMFVLMRFLRTEGPLCRDCGLATYRGMQSDTLWQGWWGPLSLFITPVTLLMNLGPRAAYYRLPPPANGILRPLDPGKPLWRRPPALLVLAAVVLVSFALPTLIVIGLLAGGDEKPQPLATDRCVRNVGDWKEQKLLVVDCSSPDAQYRVHGAPCANGDYIAALEYTPEDGSLRCLRPLDRPTR